MGKVRVDVGTGCSPRLEHGRRLRASQRAQGAQVRPLPGHPGADLDRIDHQQKLLAALRRQALRWDTVTRLPAIIKVTKENVNTDLGDTAGDPTRPGTRTQRRRQPDDYCRVRGSPQVSCPTVSRYWNPTARQTRPSCKTSASSRLTGGAPPCEQGLPRRSRHPDPRPAM